MKYESKITYIIKLSGIYVIYTGFFKVQGPPSQTVINQNNTKKDIIV